MRKISRAVQNQKNKLHEETVEKILAHLPKKDKTLAKAVKAVIYNEVKEKHKELSGLDKAAEMLRLVTKAKIDEILTKQKNEIQKVIDYLEHKQKDDKKDKETNKDKKDKKDKKDDKKDDKKIKRQQLDYESSVDDSSSYDSSDSSDTSE
jgi:hypothetical protein